MRGKQSVRKVFGTLRGKKRQYIKKKKGKGIPFELIASAAAPFLGEAAKLFLKKSSGGGRRRRRR